MAVINAQATTLTVNSSTVGQIISFSGFDGEAADIDVTTLASTAKEFRQGLQDFGNFSIEVLRDPNDAGQGALETLKGTQAAGTFVLTLPDTVVYNRATFTGYVKSITLAGGVDDVVRGTINVRISGAVVWTDSSP